MGLARREADAAHIREIQTKGQERTDRIYANHLSDHGEETETFAEDFLRETDGISNGETDMVQASVAN